MSDPSQSVNHSSWQQLLSLGEQLAAHSTVVAQQELIVETAARLMGGQADLWLAEPFHHLPNLEEAILLPAEPPSDLMRRALQAPRVGARLAHARVGARLAHARVGARLAHARVGVRLAHALAVPLLAQDTVLGVLEVKRPTGPPFSDVESELFDGLATQAAIALQATRQVAIERWRVEQLSLVRTVSAQVVSVLDLDELSHHVVDLILRAFKYYYVGLFILKPGQNILRMQASAGPPDRPRSNWGELLPSLQVQIGQGIIGHVAQTGVELLVNDVSCEPRYRYVDSLPKTQSEVVLPLKIEDRVLGVLDVQSEQPERFDETDMLVLRALADNVAIAIRNANLYRSEQWRRQVADSMREVAGLLSANVALDQVLDAILTELERTLPCDVAAVWLLHDGDLYLSAVHGYLADVCINDFSPDAGPWLAQALSADQPTIRTTQTPLSSSLEGEREDEPLGAALGFPPDYSAIAAPLRAGDRRLGLLTLAHRTPGRYGAESRAMTAAFASYAAIAIENTHLYQKTQEMARLSTVMLQVAEVTQSLTTLDQVLETVVHLVPILVGVDQCAILLWDKQAQAYVPAAAYGFGPEQQTTFDQWHIAPGDEPAFDDLRLNKTPVFIYDVATDSRLSGAVVWALGFESLLLLPLLAQGEALGAMLIDYQSDWFESGAVRTLRDERLVIIQGIALQTAAAVENTRLREAQQEEAYVSAALLQVTQAVVSLNDLDDILSAIVRITPILVGVERCIVCLWDDERSVFRPAQAYGIPRDAQVALLTQRYAPGDFPLLDAVRERDNLIVHSEGDGLIPPDFSAGFAGDTPGEPFALLAVPLSVKSDVLGVMLVEEVNTSRGFSGKRLEIITGIAHQAALAVQNDRLQQEMTERERLERELQLAHEIQQTFMPSQLPHLPGWELAVLWRAARRVAGDFYDFFELPGGRLGLVIADVADKGMPAALFMALTRALVRAAALEEKSPAAALARVNDLLVPDAQHGMFVTAVYAVLSFETGELVYANAGHNLPLLLRSRTGELEQFGKGGMALGVLEGTRLEEQSAFLEPGDDLVFYTDGVTEAFSPQDDIYGEERLRATIQAAAGSSAQALLDSIDDSVRVFVGDTPPSDDLTLMVLHRE